MKINKNKYIPLDKFINKALYNKKSGYYMKSNPFGKEGDFITGPNISILFSEMIAIWCVSFWENLGCPKKINIIELGAGNGEMMFQMIKAFNNFKKFKISAKLFILEKSNFLKKIQKKKLSSFNIAWLNSINKIKTGPNIFLANEFFDALPIKQFKKKKNKWFEKKIIKKNDKFEFIDEIANIKNIEKKIGIKLSNNQKFIEFSPLSYEFLKIISKKINNLNGGMLIIDYGCLEKKMKNTLQSVYKHNFNYFFNKFSKSDITYNLNFFLLERIAKKLNLRVGGLVNQGKFLINLGILERAEILTKNLKFSKKADIYYRLKRLIDKNSMGEIFKVMFLTKKNNKFSTGF